MTYKKTIALALFLGLPAETYLNASDIPDGSLLSSRAALSKALDEADLGSNLQVYMDNSLEGLTIRHAEQTRTMVGEIARVTGLNSYLLEFFKSFDPQSEFESEKAQLPRLISKLPSQQVDFILANLRSFEKANNFNVATYGGISYVSMLQWTQENLDHFRKLREIRSNMSYNLSVTESRLEALNDWIEAKSDE